ncbi:MAG TPA: aldehyde dehydrogenase [Syntrophobacteria bacterium]|nr:aldehyde dehydrogenase [Syntrophobacteria bacterium]
MEQMSFYERLQKILNLGDALRVHKKEIVASAVKALHFTVKDSVKEVDIAIERLKMFEETEHSLGVRAPLGGPGSRVSLMLSYNGSAWINTAITSIYLVGNRVNVKFSSKGRDVMELTESMYRPIFGEEVTFYRGDGRSFLDESLKDGDVAAVVVFGFDENVLPYERVFVNTGKKLIFEGPGQDPFIVLPDADLDLALTDLMAGKFMYSGQTCTAPKRIYIHRSIYDEFLARFVDRVKRLVVGDPADEATDVSAVASDLAVERIRLQLDDAVRLGGQILVGGRMEGNLIYPTVVKHATDKMLGMREEVFGPVAFTSSFVSVEEVLARSRNHKYGLRAAVFGGKQARAVADALRGREYCHPVTDYTFGRFGTVAVNETRASSWVGAFVTKPVGGYGYSGWIWETVEGRFQIKQGPKLLSTETSLP